MGRIFTESRYASVVSTVALVLALGSGTAYAGVLITSQDIKNGGVKRVDIHKGAVNSAKVANGTLLKGDFKAGQLPAGPAGPQGPAGPPGGPPAAKFFAAGDADGSVQRSSGDVSVNKFGTGLYRVTFPASVEGCVAVASIGATTGGNNVQVGGAGATINPGLGTGVTTVLTSNGTAAVNKPWAIAVFC